SISPHLPSLPEDLRNLGYRTWTTIANPVISMRHTLYRGWDYYSQLSVRFYNQGFLEDYSLSGYTRLAGYFSQLMVRVFYHNHRIKTPEVGLEMLEELNPAGGDFAYIHLNDPHTPYRPYERYRPENAQRVGRYRVNTWEHDLTKNDLSDLTPPEKARIRELYDGEIRFSDEYLGRVMDILDERGLWDTTALIFLADHGEEFEEHGDYTHGHVNLHHELTHIPLVVWWPGVFDQAGRRIVRPVSLCDLYPNICELVGAPYEPERLNGVSLVPLPDPDRPVFAQRFPNSPEAQRYSDFVVQGRAALHLDYTTGVEELYLDYYTDPEDVSAEHPELVEHLRDLIAEWHLRNAALQEYYGTATPDAAQDPVIRENLRAIGYIQ
ncbi:sulfatase-like hydrolase/transferase, partial [bacterium]|nr:sulfatase-like hydrolase/transferase [bacterium]